MSVDAVIAACYVKACAPPPVGKGGSAGAAARVLATRIVNRARTLDKVEGITPRVKQLAAQVGGRMYGLKYRYKTPSSLTRKIYDKVHFDRKASSEVKYAHSGVSDALRYTTVLPVAKYASGTRRIVSELQRNGYSVVEVSNKWNNANDYKAIHIIGKSPTGLKFELQVHTRRSLRTKEKLHVNYEKLRSKPPPGPRERTRLLIESYRLGRANPAEGVPGVQTIEEYP